MSVFRFIASKSTMQFAMVSLALLGANFLGSTANAQNSKTQAEVARVFHDVCLKDFPNSAAIPVNAKREGMKQISPSQWNAADPDFFISFVPLGEKTGNMSISLNRPSNGQPFGYGWNAKPKKPEGDCSLLSFVQTQNLHEHFLGTVAADLKAKIRVKKSGKSGEIIFKLNDVKAKLIFHEVRLDSSLIKLSYMSISKR